MLNEVVQVAIGWGGEHLWEFTIARQRYSVSEYDDGDDGPDASELVLGDVLRPRRTTFEYMYDFGDSWVHTMTVTRLRPGTPGLYYPRSVAGERAGPPEGCGGISTYNEISAALTDPIPPGS